MKHLLIVFHSQTGNTEQLARAAFNAAQEEEGTETRILNAFDATLDDLLWCNGLIIATPENFGYMCGAIKDFFDRTYYPAEPYHLNRPYALLVSAGNDGTGAVRECDRILSGYPMKKVLEPCIARGEITQEYLDQAAETGQTLACGLAFGIY